LLPVATMSAPYLRFRYQIIVRLNAN
jgi:hypothetical protein